MEASTERIIPDVSLELDKVLNYADFLRDDIGGAPADGNGYICLTRNQVETYSWMLGDIGNMLHNLGEALYPGLIRATKGSLDSKTEQKKIYLAEPANSKTGGNLDVCEIEDVTDKLAVLCNALAHEADKVGTAAQTPLNYSDAHGLLTLALEAHVTLHKQIYGMAPAEMAGRRP